MRLTFVATITLAFLLAVPGLGKAQVDPAAGGKVEAPEKNTDDKPASTDAGTEKKTKKKGPKKAKDGKEPKKQQSVRISSNDPYSVYSTGLFQEVYIDESFQLYATRKYGGVVPGKNEAEFANVQPTDGEGKLLIHRIGFEQRELFSRLFVLASSSISPWVYDNFAEANANPEINYQIYIEIPGAKIPKHNDRRPLITTSFNTPVASIEGRHMEGGVRVVITLKREARYLPVQVGRLLYIDVER